MKVVLEIDGSLPLSLSPSLLDSKKSHGRKRFDWFLQTSSLAFSFFFGGEGRAEGAAFASLFAFFLSFFFLSLFLLSPPGARIDNNNNLPIRA